MGREAWQCWRARHSSGMHSKASFFLLVSKSPARPFTGSLGTSSTDSMQCFETIKEMDFCKSFLETYCFDTVIFSILPKQISLPFRLLHCEMIPFSNSVLKTMQRHCSPHWLSGEEKERKKKKNEKRLLKTEYKLYLKQFSENQWLQRLWARTAGSKPSHFPFKAWLPVAFSRPHIS